MATTTTRNASGIREELSDLLADVGKHKLPLTTLLNKFKVSQDIYSWQTDEFSNPTHAGTDEGSDTVSFEDKAKDRAILTNYTQEERESYSVSDHKEAALTAGVSSELGRSRMKALYELKANMESAICSNNDRQIQGSAGTPWKTRGFFDQVDSAGPSDVPATHRTDTLAIDNTASASFTEDMLNIMLQAIHEEGFPENNRLVYVVGPTMRRTLSKNLARMEGGTTAVNYMLTDSSRRRTAMLNINFYDSDYGFLEVLSSNFLRRTSGDAIAAQSRVAGALINRDYFDIAEFIPITPLKLPNQGGGPREQFKWVAGTRITPRAHGKQEPSS